MRFERNEVSRAKHVLEEGGDDSTHQERHCLRPVEPAMAEQDRGRGQDRQHGDREAAVVEEKAGDRAQRIEEAVHADAARRAAPIPREAAAKSTAMTARIPAWPEGPGSPSAPPHPIRPNAESTSPAAALRESCGTR